VPWRFWEFLTNAIRRVSARPKAPDIVVVNVIWWRRSQRRLLAYIRLSLIPQPEDLMKTCKTSLELRVAVYPKYPDSACPASHYLWRSHTTCAYNGSVRIFCLLVLIAAAPLPIRLAANAAHVDGEKAGESATGNRAPAGRNQYS
jgi:hypothetical protein